MIILDLPISSLIPCIKSNLYRRVQFEVTAAHLRINDLYTSPPMALNSGCRDSSAGTASDWKARRRCGKFFVFVFVLFLSQSQLFNVDSFTVFVQFPCAIACISICAHNTNSKHWQPYHWFDSRKVLHSLWLLCFIKVSLAKFPAGGNGSIFLFCFVF